MSTTSLTKPTKTKEEFVSFVYALADDLQQNRESWENPQLDQFLRAFAAWVTDMDAYYMNMKMPIPQNIDWSTIKDMFMAARTYE